MARTITIFGAFLVAGLFAWLIPLVRLFDVIQPIIVGVSIMVAAVFVRLNRGMPTLEWKSQSLEPEGRKNLTASILQVTIEYGWVIAINAVALAGLVTLLAIGKTDAAQWPDWVRRATSGVVGWIAVLSVARMVYVVSRDIDIVKLQKHLIDRMAARDSNERDLAIVDGTVAKMKSAAVRAVEIKPPKAWGE